LNAGSNGLTGPEDRKKVQRLMRTMDLAAQYPKRNLSLANQAHKVYPYLLRDLVIERLNPVWATDLIDIPMARGFVYRVAIMCQIGGLARGCTYRAVRFLESTSAILTHIASRVTLHGEPATCPSSCG
jgi:hypothetical protein